MKSIYIGIFLLVGLDQMILAEEAQETYEVTYEVFSLPLREAAKLRRKNSGGVAMHAHLVKSVEKKETRQEKWMLLKIAAGQNSSLEEIEEYIYPTEFEASDGLPCYWTPTGSEQFPNHFKSPPFPISYPPISFDTKKLGDTIEVEITVLNHVTKLRLSATHVDHLKNDSFGKGHSKQVMPRFSVQRILGRVKVGIGKPALVGTISPPRENQKEKEKRVWLAFVTLEKI